MFDLLIPLKATVGTFLSPKTAVQSLTETSLPNTNDTNATARSRFLQEELYLIVGNHFTEDAASFKRNPPAANQAKYKLVAFDTFKTKVSIQITF